MDWIVGLATLVALGLSSWTMLQTVDHGSRIAVIEDSRFTDADAAHMKEQIIESVQTPRWIEERFNLIAQQNAEISRQLDAIDRRMREER
jgi:hypothetical protein